MNGTLLYERARRLTSLLKRWFSARAVDGGRFFLQASASTFKRRLVLHAHCDDCVPWPVILTEPRWRCWLGYLATRVGRPFTTDGNSLRVAEKVVCHSGTWPQRCAGLCGARDIGIYADYGHKGGPAKSGWRCRWRAWRGSLPCILTNIMRSLP